MTSAKPFDSRRSLPAEQAYLFRHAVVRDAAYSLQLPGERALLHALALRVLEDLTPDDQLDHTAALMAEHARLAREGGAEPERMLAAETRHLATAVRYAADKDDLTSLLALAALQAGLPGAPPRERIEALVLAGQAALGLGRREYAEQVARELLESATALGDQAQVGRAHRALSTVLQIKGHGEEADRHIRKSIEILEQASDWRELANSLIGAGFFAMIYGRHQESRRHIRRAMELSADFPFEMSKAKRAMGDTLMRTGEYDAAMQNYRESIETLPASLPRQHAAPARKGIAFALSRLGRNEEAAAELHQLLEQALKAGRYQDAVNCYTLLGEIESDRGELDQAEAYMRSALRLAMEGQRPDRATAFSNLGALLVRRGQLAEAESLLEESLRLRNPAMPQSDMVSLTFFLGELRLLQNRPEHALQQFRHCRELSRKFGDTRYGERLQQRLESLDSGVQPG